MIEKKSHERRYWVVSPNVNFDRAVSDWRQASVKFKCAFMGYGPDRERIGSTFAYGIKEGDILLIARSHRNKPEIVGFGIVKGNFKRKLIGFTAPGSYGALRRLSPFQPWTVAPRGFMGVLNHKAALRKLRPDKDLEHKRICEWMESKLSNSDKNRSRTGSTGNSGLDNPRIGELPIEPGLEYEVRTKGKVLRARKRECELVKKYKSWLENQDLEIHTLKYRNLSCDLYEKHRKNLVEAKCSERREYVRMAVGQLFDYEWLGRKRFGRLNKAILLPKEPKPDILEWLLSLGIYAIWHADKEFLDNANGRFT